MAEAEREGVLGEEAGEVGETGKYRTLASR